MILFKLLFFFILYLILFLVVLLLLMLISPIKGFLSFDNKSVFIKASYFFGLIRVTYDGGLLVRLFGFKVKSNGKASDPEIEEKEKDKPKKEKKSRASNKKKLKIPSKRVIVLSLELVKKLIKKIAPKKAKLHLTLGLDDPYYTQLINITSMVLFMPLNRIKNYDFNLQPDLYDIAIDYEGEFYINFSIMSLILPCLTFILKKPIRDYFGISFKKLFKKRQPSS